MNSSFSVLSALLSK